jgi:hypothetical protein
LRIAFCNIPPKIFPLIVSNQAKELRSCSKTD